jgi:hypothetical protein
LQRGCKLGEGQGWRKIGTYPQMNGGAVGTAPLHKAGDRPRRLERINSPESMTSTRKKTTPAASTSADLLLLINLLNLLIIITKRYDEVVEVLKTDIPEQRSWAPTGRVLPLGGILGRLR